MPGKITKTLEERMMLKTIKDPLTGCWYWSGYKTKEGFGQLRRPGKLGKLDYAHRISYELAFGILPKDIKIFQRCKNKSCLNPDHLLASEDQSIMKYTDVKERLMSRLILTESGCWEYTGFRNESNYGRMGYGPRILGVEYCHRISYEVHYGEIPKDQFVLHKCDYPPCVNPEHLFLGSQDDNVQDAIKKGRMWFQN